MKKNPIKSRLNPAGIEEQGILEINEQQARIIQGLFEKVWIELNKNEKNTKIPRKELARRVFHIATRMTLDLVSKASAEEEDYIDEIEDAEWLGEDTTKYTGGHQHYSRLGG